MGLSPPLPEGTRWLSTALSDRATPSTTMSRATHSSGLAQPAPFQGAQSHTGCSWRGLSPKGAWGRLLSPTCGLRKERGICTFAMIPVDLT